MALKLRVLAQLSRLGFFVILSAAPLGACVPAPTYVEPLAHLRDANGNSVVRPMSPRVRDAMEKALRGDVGH